MIGDLPYKIRDFFYIKIHMKNNFFIKRLKAEGSLALIF